MPWQLMRSGGPDLTGMLRASLTLRVGVDNRGRELQELVDSDFANKKSRSEEGA
jgi:hypothetical protein